jgi:amino acid transporter
MANKSRSLGLLSVMALGINTIVGSGIFRFPAELAGDLGTASVLSFALCAVMLATVSLSFAELGGMIDKEGGIYAYGQAAFGPWIGFAVGWAAWISTLLTLAAVAVAVPGQLAELSPALGEPVTAKLLAASIVIAFGVLNLMGTRSGAWTGNALVIIKVGALVLFVAIGAFYVQRDNLTPFAPKGYAPLGPAMLFAFFALSGFETSAVPAGEAENAKRNVPIAVLGSLFGAAGLYTLIQFVAVGVLPTLATSKRPLADATRVFAGDGGALAMSLVGTLSMLGLCAAMAFAAPRFVVALGEDGHIPKALSAWHPRYDSPAAAIVLGTLLAVVLAVALDFRSLVDFTSVILIVQYMIVCAAVLQLRRRWPTRHRTWKVPLGPLLPLTGIGLLAWVLLQSAWLEIGLGIGVMAFGAMLRLARPRAKESQP